MITREIKFMENELDNIFAYLKQIECSANSINSILEYIEIERIDKTYDVNKKSIIEKCQNITKLTNNFVGNTSYQIDVIKKMIYELI